MPPSYKKTTEGVWVVCGEPHEIHEGMVPVTKRDGSVRETLIVKVSKPFLIDGKQKVYGYLADEKGKAITQLDQQSSKTSIPESFQKELVEKAQKLVSKYNFCDHCGKNVGEIEVQDDDGQWGIICSSCSLLKEKFVFNL